MTPATAVSRTPRTAELVPPIRARAEFFVLRVPAFARTALEDDASDGVPRDESAEAVDEAWRRRCARLRERARDPLFREALFIASPTLEAELDAWLASPNREDGQRITLSIAKYFFRASGRPTPFGLFSTCSMGRTGGPDTRLRLATDGWIRRTRFDAQYLGAVARAAAEATRADDLVVRANGTLYQIGDRLHYVEVRTTKSERQFVLSTTAATEYLMRVVRAAGSPKPLRELAALLVSDEITEAEAIGFLRELLASNVLVSELEPSITSDAAMDDLTRSVAAVPDLQGLAQELRRAHEELARIDRDGVGLAPARYVRIADMLAATPVKPEIGRLVQVDALRRPECATLGQNVVDELVSGASLLLALTQSADHLAAFRTAFTERYERRTVPLLEVLNVEHGIGFPEPEESAAKPRNEEVRQTQLNLILRAMRTGSIEVELGDDDVTGLIPSGARGGAPDAFSVVATLIADSEDAVARGAFRVFLQNAAGPSGANLLGRFCDCDRDLCEAVAGHLRAEEALDPESVFAEIVHLPRGDRVGNVVYRPPVRRHAIVIAGRAGGDGTEEIPLKDLRVSVVSDRVVLTAPQFAGEIIPRLTTAHSFAAPNNLQVYRFLAMLQGQGMRAATYWSWGTLGSAAFLPRVVRGRLVLSRAEWRIGTKLLEQAGSIDRRWGAIQRWRERSKVPRHVLLKASDNMLPIDLEDILAVEVLWDEIKRDAGGTLVEQLPGPNDLVARGGEGRFTHELIVPFVQTRQPRERKRTPSVRTTTSAVDQPRTRRVFGPASEWITAKLYCGRGVADRILREAIWPVVRGLQSSGVIDRWFFLRYHDPEHHLRLRLHGDPAGVRSSALPALDRLFTQAHHASWIHRMVLDTYQREIERYGGDGAIEFAESCFHIDSGTALALMGAWGNQWPSVRALVALRAADDLARAFGVAPTDRHALYRAYTDGAPSDKRRAWSLHHRAHRAQIDAVMGDLLETPFDRARDVLSARYAALEAQVAQYREVDTAAPGVAGEALQGHIHMSFNRLGINGTDEEVGSYEMLRRAHETLAAKRRQSAAPVVTSTA